MPIKNIDEQKEIFDNYTNNYMNENDEQKQPGYIDKHNHSIFVLDEAMLVDAIFTNYNPQFKNLLALESLFHDIGRFEQLKQTGTFEDIKLNDYYKGISDHGDLGAIVIKEHELLNELIPDIRLYDEEVQEVIRLHSKVVPNLLDGIMKDYITAFNNYDLEELFLSKKSDKEKEVLTKVNTAIIQDVDRLDIFRKIVKGIWVPMATQDKIDAQIFELFKQGKIPSINEMKKAGKYNPNIGHLVRLSFINQMNLVPILIKIRNENLLDKVYEVTGNEVVEPAYEIMKERLDKLIENSDDGIIVKKQMK